MSRFDPQGKFSVGEYDLQWSIRHYGGGSSLYDEKRGLSVSISSAKEKGRELHIEFDFRDYFFEKPKSGAEFKKRLVACVARALNSRWKPESKGKPLKISASELEN